MENYIIKWSDDFTEDEELLDIYLNDSQVNILNELAMSLSGINTSYDLTIEKVDEDCE